MKEPVLERGRGGRRPVGRPMAPVGVGRGKLVKMVIVRRLRRSPGLRRGEVGRLAEEANHHPDIDIRYNRVTLALVTHDSGGITRLDLDLAQAIDGITGRRLT